MTFGFIQALAAATVVYFAWLSYRTLRAPTPRNRAEWLLALGIVFMTAPRAVSANTVVEVGCSVIGIALALFGGTRVRRESISLS